MSTTTLDSIKAAVRQEAFSFISFSWWLEKHAPDAVVGIAKDCDACPIHAYLKAKTGHEIRVGACHLQYDGQLISDDSGDNLALLMHPRWIKWFVCKLDSAFPERTEVTASEAIAILKPYIDFHRS